VGAFWGAMGLRGAVLSQLAFATDILTQCAPFFRSPDDWGTEEAFVRSLVYPGVAVYLVILVAACAVVSRSLCLFDGERPLRPTSGSIWCAVAVVLVLTLAASIACALGRSGAEFAFAQFDAAVSESSRAVPSAMAALSAVRDANATLQDSIERWQGTASNFYSVSEGLEEVCGSLEAFGQEMDGRLQRLSAVPHFVRDFVDSEVKATLPFILGALVVCLAISCHVLVARFRRCRCGGCSVRLMGALLVAPAVLFVGLASAATWPAGLYTASFCRDPDANVLLLAGAQDDEFLRNVTRYYLAGEGRNPLSEDLLGADTAIGEARRAARRGVRGRQRVRGGVPLRTTAFEQQLDRAQAQIRQASVHLSSEELYPFFEAAAQLGVCQRVLGGLALLGFASFALAAFGLPALSVAAVTYFERRGAAPDEEADAVAVELSSAPFAARRWASAAEGR